MSWVKELNTTLRRVPSISPTPRLRIIRACRELEIETVAVFSDADANAPHVAAADYAAAIGPAAAADSYLSAPNLIAAARAHNADAVHPGYGFLSENAHLGCEDSLIGRTSGCRHRAHGIEDRGAPVDGDVGRARRAR
jgi:hypothetical protein